MSDPQTDSQAATFAAIESHTVQLGSHQCHYLACGPETGPLIFFVHGWPELSRSWRHQLPVFGALGFRAIAPDMRGYGNSSVYDEQSDYAQEKVVGDLCALQDKLGGQSAVWVGHDWGSPSVWNMASHHPDRCTAVASLCVPYASLERGLDNILKFVDRTLYPEETFPAGQWEYMRFYEENFASAVAEFNYNSKNAVQLLFRKGDPASFGQQSATAYTRINKGWFGEAGGAPEFPRDADVVTEEDINVYAEALERNGWFGPSAYYVNSTLNAEYASTAVNEGHLAMPALFIAAQYDSVCETINSRLAEPMRKECDKLSEAVIYSGHWMAQEKPAEVNSVLVKWLRSEVEQFWPVESKS
ncbi:MAG: pimeloyl-ACP methyl ester carboxylesterase [Candidatus Azotimanducaceae bacterium]|jgi:pimeloyl-ACP methyl ester carboxylesterase